MNGKKKVMIGVWLAVLCLLLMVTGTYAAYISLQSAKMVAIAKAKSMDYRFSSNYMDPCVEGEAAPTKLVAFSSNSDAAVYITVCNYPQNDMSQVSEIPITYTLTATLKKAEGDEVVSQELAGKFQLDGRKFENGTMTLEGSLKGSETDLNRYVFTCAKDDLEFMKQVSLEISAVPNEANVLDTGMGLRARLQFSVAGESLSWSGGFLETESAYSDPKQLDAFNYEIHGTSRQTAVLQWDTKKVILGRWSLAELDPNAQYTNGMSQVGLDLGGDGKPTSYRLQFYRADGIPENETWADVLNYVTFRVTSTVKDE